MPFEAITLDRGYEGLSIPGVGYARYTSMARALEQIITAAVTGTPAEWVLDTAPYNGYQMIWDLFKVYLPHFNPKKPLPAYPVWADFGGNVTMFAHACSNWHTLSAHKGHSFTEYEQSVMFFDVFPVEFEMSTKRELLQFVEHGSGMLLLEYTVLGLDLHL